MRTLLNILWNVPGFGFVVAFCWVLAGLLMAVTIIGLPWAKACFTLANYTLAPFGREDVGTGPLGFLGNLIWLVLAGWWLALGHLVIAIALAITIIGIPFAWAHLKLAGLALWPIGKAIVPAEQPAFRR